MISIHLSPPHLGTEERSLLGEALDSNWVAPLGPQVDAFESGTLKRLARGRRTTASRERLLVKVLARVSP